MCFIIQYDIILKKGVDNVECTIISIVIIIVVIISMRNSKRLKENRDAHVKRRKSECKLFLQSNNFDATKIVNISNASSLYIDTKSRRFLIYDFAPNNNEEFRIYKYSDIINAELYEDGVVTQKASIGGALVGGVLAGGAGAIVGSQTTPNTKGTCKLMFVKLTVKDVENPYIQINLIKGKEYDKSDNEYLQILESANRAIATFSAMKES